MPIFPCAPWKGKRELWMTGPIASIPRKLRESTLFTDEVSRTCIFIQVLKLSIYFITDPVSGLNNLFAIN